MFYVKKNVYFADIFSNKVEFCYFCEKLFFIKSFLKMHRCFWQYIIKIWSPLFDEISRIKLRDLLKNCKLQIQLCCSLYKESVCTSQEMFNIIIKKLNFWVVSLPRKWVKYIICFKYNSKFGTSWCLCCFQ